MRPGRSIFRAHGRKKWTRARSVGGGAICSLTARLTDGLAGARTLGALGRLDCLLVLIAISHTTLAVLLKQRRNWIVTLMDDWNFYCERAHSLSIKANSNIYKMGLMFNAVRVNVCAEMLMGPSHSCLVTCETVPFNWQKCGSSGLSSGAIHSKVNLSA